MVAADGSRLVLYRIYAEPFRIPLLARADTIDIRAELGEAEPGGPVTTVRLDQHARGSAMGHRAETREVLAFSDFERVKPGDAPPLPD